MMYTNTLGPALVSVGARAGRELQQLERPWREAWRRARESLRWEQGMVGGSAPAGSGLEQHHSPLPTSRTLPASQRWRSGPGCCPRPAERPGWLQPQHWDTSHSCIPIRQHSPAGPEAVPVLLCCSEMSFEILPPWALQNRLIPLPCGQLLAQLHSPDQASGRAQPCTHLSHLLHLLAAPGGPTQPQQLPPSLSPSLPAGAQSCCRRRWHSSSPSPASPVLGTLSSQSSSTGTESPL